MYSQTPHSILKGSIGIISSDPTLKVKCPIHNGTFKPAQKCFAENLIEKFIINNGGFLCHTQKQGRKLTEIVLTNNSVLIDY